MADKAMTPEAAANHLRAKGVTQEQLNQLKALPAVNWGLLVAFVNEHGSEIQKTISDFLAIFGR